MSDNKLPSQQIQFAKLAEDLIFTAPPAEWLDFLFELQLRMIGAGLFGTMSPSYADTHSANMGALKDFFTKADLIINDDQ